MRESRRPMAPVPTRSRSSTGTRAGPEWIAQQGRLDAMIDARRAAISRRARRVSARSTSAAAAARPRSRSRGASGRAGRVLGVDISSAMLARARTRARGRHPHAESANATRRPTRSSRARGTRVLALRRDVLRRSARDSRTCAARCARQRRVRVLAPCPRTLDGGAVPPRSRLPSRRRPSGAGRARAVLVRRARARERSADAGFRDRVAPHDRNCARRRRPTTR